MRTLADDSYRQPPPFAIEVELTKGCNLRCSFCAIQGITERSGTYVGMTPALADTIGRQIADAGWVNSRIEFSGRGEPTMHSFWLECIHALMRHLPKNHALLITNGGGLVKDPLAKINAAFDAGIRTVALDNYRQPYLSKIIRDIELILPITYYPQTKKYGSPMQKRTKGRYLFVVDGECMGDPSMVNNRCGAAKPPVASPLKKACCKPFREFGIRYDGQIFLCCNDWRGEFDFLRVFTGENFDADAYGLDDIWNGRRYHTVRRALYNGRRDLIAPCAKCDFNGGFRIGLLPDNTGKVGLRPPDRDDADELSYDGPREDVVLRPWEEE